MKYDCCIILIFFNEGSVFVNTKSYLRDETIGVLSGTQPPKNQLNEPATSSEPSRWERFKAKVRNAWNTVMKAAEDIRDKIMPIVTGMGCFLANWATYCNRNSNRKGVVQHGHHNPLYW